MKKPKRGRPYIPADSRSVTVSISLPPDLAAKLERLRRRPVPPNASASFVVQELIRAATE